MPSKKDTAIVVTAAAADASRTDPPPEPNGLPLAPAASPALVPHSGELSAPPPIAPHANRWEAMVHETVWVTGRAFGFQAFNVNSTDSRDWVPATLFVAGDHLVSLLVRNMYLRDKAPQTDEHRFARAVWELHSTIFTGYQTQWCKAVGLGPRPKQLDALLSSDFASPVVAHGLLTELALYFLMYTESANLRHTPEGLWFLYWALAHSPSMAALWGPDAAAAVDAAVAVVAACNGSAAGGEFVGDSSDGTGRGGDRRRVTFGGKGAGEEAGAGGSAGFHSVGGGAMARYRRVVLRNALQQEFHALRAQVGHDPRAASLDECADMMRFLSDNLPPLAPSAVQLRASDRCLLADLLSHGDGGQYLDRIVAPIFMLMSFEQDARQGLAEEVTFRIGYDDINECLNHRPSVQKLLGLLGVTKPQYHDVNNAYVGLTRLGCDLAATALETAPSSALFLATAASAGGAGSGGGGASNAPFDVERAATFWAEHIFAKTYRERRSWLSVWRAFYRVYCFHAVLIHLLFAQALAPQNLRIISSAVLTHAFCHFLERFASVYMTRLTKNPLAPDTSVKGKKAKAVAKAKADADAEAALEASEKAAANPASLEAVRLRRPILRVEGMACLVVFGCVEWLLVFIGMAAMCALQYIEGAPLQELAHQYWMFLAGGYSAMHIAHALLSTRDGYCVSLTAMLRLPSFFRASSARPDATYWAPGSMKTGGGAFWLTALFWIQALVVKGIFDYFVILKPLADPVRAILTTGWLACPTKNYSIVGFELPVPCIGGEWLLLAVRCFPCFLICFMDTHIFYQFTLMTWGMVRGLFLLDVGVVNDWESLRREFHRAPGSWWAKCMSAAGNANRIAVVAARRAGINLDILGYSNLNRSASSLFRSSDDGGAGGSHASDDGHGGNGRMSDDGGASFSAVPTSSHACDSFTSFSAQPAWALNGKKAKGGARTSKTGGTGGGGKGEGGGKGKSGKTGKAISYMGLMLQGRSDEQVAMWEAFATAWDAIVADLREADLLSDTERVNLEFVRLAGGGSDGCGDAAALGEAGAVRPILLPAFYYAGQTQRMVDSGLASPSQCLVLAELRGLFVFLGMQLGLLTPPLVSALLAATFCNQVVDLAHSASREKMLRSAVRLLAEMRGIAPATGATTTGGRRRQAAAAAAAAALADMVTCLEFECTVVQRIVNKKVKGGLRGMGPKELSAAENLLGELGAMKVGVMAEPATVHACFRALYCDGSDDGGGACSSSSSAAPPSIMAVADPDLLRRVVDVLHTMLTVSAADAQPSSAEARRVLGFFMSSLADRELGANGTPPPLDESPSHTVLTPCYEEDVLYPIDAQQAARDLGCHVGGGAEGGAHGGHGVTALGDLLTESEDRVSLMSYLRSVFPKDWENFKQRLGQKLGGFDLALASEDDFGPGGYLYQHRLQLQLWASFRGQLLARTVRGMMAYDTALRVMARMEYPCPPNLSVADYEAWLEALVSDKFNYIVSSQVYGRNRKSRDPRQRWLAEGLDVLLEEFPRLKAAFIDSAIPTPEGQVSFSVLARSRRPATGVAAAAGMYSYRQKEDGGRIEEMYRVRLPANRYTNRGPIIGEGKPENQNHATIFCFGEALQTIDMNQDNHVCEALKMRNLLTELRPAYRNAKAKALARAPLDGSALTTPPAQTAVDFHRALMSRRTAERPVALVGFREWIFSDKSGAMGSFAASAELAFGTIVQRTMSSPAAVRLHYGHPDVFNKLHVMTRGGVSKATRQIHVSEDIFGGFNHILRGGQIKYREYLAVGKGRDMGFDTINAFEIKISGGNGEVLISRDLLRISTRFDFFRLLHFYHSGPGYYLNNYITMATVYLQLFSILFFALAHASTVIRAVPDPTNPDIIQNYTIDETNRVINVLQLGTLSILPYLAELLLEVGPVRAARIAIWQLVAGSLSFFIFKQQTTAYYYADDQTYGGASYVSTGRGFNITTSQFLKIFTNYARSHIYLGFELSFMAIVYAMVQDCNSCSYGGTMWGSWLVAASLFFAPFWFNPMTFDSHKVGRDLVAWNAWLAGEVDPTTGVTWHAWNRKQLEKMRNDRGNQTNHGLNVAANVVIGCLPPALLALASVSRLHLKATLKLPFALLGSSWIIFAIATAIMWLFVFLTTKLANRWKNSAQQHRWRIFCYASVAASVLLLVAYFAALPLVFHGPVFPNLLIFFYANLNLMLVAHRGATHLCTTTPRGRAFVDAGFHLMDTMIGYILLALLGLLSLFAFIGRIQATLLFSSSFARSVRRGGIVRTIGLLKVANAADPRAQAEEAAAAANKKAEHESA